MDSGLILAVYFYRKILFSDTSFLLTTPKVPYLIRNMGLLHLRFYTNPNCLGFKKLVLINQKFTYDRHKCSQIPVYRFACNSIRASIVRNSADYRTYALYAYNQDGQKIRSDARLPFITRFNRA